jgi:LmbE family N-acetylglucosaminyl deacetylase
VVWSRRRPHERDVGTDDEDAQRQVWTPAHAVSSATSSVTPVIVDPPAAADIMVVAAHPDDIESWCAGTLARSIDAGATVRLLLVTSGDKGSDDPRATPADVAGRREREALEAARRLGIVEVAFLRHPDGEVEYTRTLRGQIVGPMRRWRPAVLFTHDPDHPYHARPLFP